MIPFFISQNNLKWTFSRHDTSLSHRRYHTLILAKCQQTIRNIIYEENHLVGRPDRPSVFWPYRIDWRRLFLDYSL